MEHPAFRDDEHRVSSHDGAGRDVCAMGERTSLSEDVEVRL